jgi:hypothetical protein
VRGSGAQAWGGAAVGAIIVCLGSVWALTKHGLVNTLGDVARYVQPKPDNIAIRQAIRDAGVDLLATLHKSREYDRIVVFGHSLGSIVAYDVLSFAWIKWGRRHQHPASTHGRALRAVESTVALPEAGETPGPDRDAAVQDAQSLQVDAWREYRANGMPWLVTDFITAGSPLCHARILLPFDKSTSFDDLANELVFPTCPPRTSHAKSPATGEIRSVFSYVRAYRDLSTGQRKSVVVPHHAALFALTRWTNLYFPHTHGLRGDPVGGPLAPIFGWWVKDKALTHPGNRFPGFAHTLYWNGHTPKTAHIEEVRESLNLNVEADLNELSKSVPLS